MNRGPSPCMDCGERFAGCHSVCLRYGNWQQARKDALKASMARMEATSGYRARMRERKKRWEKSQERKK